MVSMNVKNNTVLHRRQTAIKGGHFFPAVLLFFLAPIFGEYLLGILSLSEVYYVLFLAPMYGGGALLIREFTRRAGRGTVTMLMLGVAYGLLEEGMIDQMLFNPHYLTGQDWNTYIPLLGIDGRLTIYVLGMHAIWSTCIPILLVESIFPERKFEPWLGRRSVVIMTSIFTLGSAYLCYETKIEKDFFASIPQLLGTAIAALIVVFAAFKSRRQTRFSRSTTPPKPWFIGMVSLVASSMFMMADSTYGWTSVGACVCVLIFFFSLVYRWSRSHEWDDEHLLALLGGGILTYVWLGMFSGSFIFGFMAILLLIIAKRRLRTYRLAYAT